MNMPYLTVRDIENNIPEDSTKVCYRRLSLFLIFIALTLFTIAVFLSSSIIKIQLVVTGNVIFAIGIIILYYHRRPV